MFGCGGSSGGGGASVSPAYVTEIGALTLATSSVTDDPDTEAGGTAAGAVATQELSTRFATQGTRVDAGVSAVFEEQSSIAACEAFGVAHRFFAFAGQNDAYLCFLQKIIENSGRLRTNLYDGEPHVITLNTQGTSFCTTIVNCPEIALVISMDNERKTNDAGGVTYGKINSFELSVCRDGVLIAKTNQVFDSFDFAVSMSGVSRQTNADHEYEISVATKMNSDLVYRDEKTITLDYTATYNSDDEFERASESGSVSLVQIQDAISLDAAMSGAYADGAHGWEESFSGTGALLDKNTSAASFKITQILFGEGTASGTLNDAVYLPSGSLSFDESWDSDFTIILPSDTAASLRPQDAVSFATDDDAAAVSDSCASLTSEESFDLADLPSSDMARCEDFLVSDDFQNCWYFVDF